MQTVFSKVLRSLMILLPVPPSRLPMNKFPTLEQRIAAALTSTDITSSDLAASIQAVEVAAQVADEDATKAREQALDPGVVVDTAKVGAAVATAVQPVPRSA